MKEKYSEAEMEIVLLGREDVITTSNEVPDDPDPWG